MAGDQIRSSMGTVAALGCMKMLMIIFNFIFWVTGIAILALGIWMKVQLYMYMEIVSNYTPTSAYVLIGIGATIMVIGMLGCCCTFKGNSVLLYMYAVFLILMFIAELSVGISGFIYRGKLETNMQKGLTDALARYPTDKETAKALDGIQGTLHCCGVNNYTNWFPVLETQGFQNAVPDSCCKEAAENCVHTNLPGGVIGEHNMTIYTQGCHKLVVSFIDTNFGIIGGTVIGLSFFMLFGALISCCLAKQLNRSKYEQVA